MLAACFAFGWFSLLADEYGQLGKHIAAGAGFVSNLVFWREAGYFDNAADTKPLLHLWSLGVEEQFYLLWPFALWFSWKKRLNISAVIAAVAALSFAANISAVRGDAAAAFYSPVARFWELMIGAFLANRRAGRENGGDVAVPRDLQSIFGFALIVAAVFLIGKDKLFPGWWALMPAAGAYFIVAAGDRSWLNRAILSNRVLVWFGLISYPLYLWHWPLLSFARIVAGGVPAREIRLAAVAASVALAWLTYKLIEGPMRSGGRAKLKTAILCAAMLAVGSAGYGSYARGGLAFRSFNRRSSLFAESSARAVRGSECFDVDHAHDRADNWMCRLNAAGGQARVFVYGDSHALTMLPVFEKIAGEKKIDVLFSGFSGCPPLLGIQSLRSDRDKRNCHDLNERIFKYVVKNRMSDVVLIARWTYYTQGGYDGPGDRGEYINLIGRPDDRGRLSLQSSRAAFEYGLKTTIARYSKAGIKIQIVQDVPMQLRDPKDSFRRISRRVSGLQAGIVSLSVSRRQHLRLQNSVNSAFQSYSSDPNVGVVDLDPVYCRNEVCPFASESASFYFDADHLSVSGAMLAEDRLKNYFDETRRSRAGSMRPKTLLASSLPGSRRRTFSMSSAASPARPWRSRSSPRPRSDCRSSGERDSASANSLSASSSRFCARAT